MTWWRERAGVRLRSSLAAAGVVAVALGLGLVGGYVLLRTSLTAVTVDAVTARAEEVAAEVAQEGRASLGTAPAPALGGDVVQVLDGDGRVLVAVPAAAAGLRLPVPVPGPADRSAAVSQVPALPGSGVDEPFAFRALRVRDGVDGVPVVVVVGRNVAGLSETVGLVGQLAVVGVPLLVLIAGGVTYLFTGRALQPVERIRRRVAEISVTGLGERVPVPVVRDEIGRLAETMNQMLARLEGGQRSMRQFVADAGHELRSPVATVAIAVERALALPDGPPTHRGAVDGVADVADVADVEPTRVVPVSLLRDVQVETARLARLVAGLQFLARADERGLALRREDVDLDDLVSAEAARLRALPGSPLTVAVRCSAARVVGDRDRLAQVIRNLADNAARHAARQVRLSLAQAAGTAVVTVDDDGPGVPTGDRERIFDRFVRLDEARTRDGGGYGLGLAICREIVMAHGGRIEALDSDLGGARFVVELSADE